MRFIFVEYSLSLSGGPGGSGVDYVLELSTYFREIIGPNYDLVGFDPRGQLTSVLPTLYI